MMAAHPMSSISEDTSPLASLVNFERTIEKVDVEQPIKVQLLSDMKMIRLDYKGDQIFGRLERPLMHQLGSRLWREENDFKAINDRWNKLAAESLFQLEEDIAELFTHHDLQLRVYSGKGGQNLIYGIVSPNFIDVNQVEFREAYIKEFHQITQTKPQSYGIEKDRYGNIVETLPLNSFGFQTEYRNVLVYAKNNGYDSYKVNWGRLVLICSNGLRAWEGSKYRWKHTNEIKLHDFITNTIAEGKANQSHLEKCIARAQAIDINSDLYAEMINRLSLAHASKARIDERLKIECQEVGRNEWALSQAFTWLGTHEKALPYQMKPKLRDFGTDILEKSLKSVLQEKAKLTKDGYFNLLCDRDLISGLN